MMMMVAGTGSCAWWVWKGALATRTCPVTAIISRARARSAWTSEALAAPVRRVGLASEGVPVERRGPQWAGAREAQPAEAALRRRADKGERPADRPAPEARPLEVAACPVEAGAPRAEERELVAPAAQAVRAGCAPPTLRLIRTTAVSAGTSAGTRTACSRGEAAMRPPERAARMALVETFSVTASRKRWGLRLAPRSARASANNAFNAVAATPRGVNGTTATRAARRLAQRSVRESILAKRISGMRTSRCAAAAPTLSSDGQSRNYSSAQRSRSSFFPLCRRWELNPHTPYGIADFESAASASSATSAWGGVSSRPVGSWVRQRCGRCSMLRNPARR